MNDSYTKTIYVFTDVDLSCVAAIEYVIYKYGTEEWFNAALNKVVMDIYTKTRKEICHIPFIITKKEFTKSREILLTYKGFHYIICQIEKYKNTFGGNSNNDNSSSVTIPPPLIIFPPIE